MGRRFQSELHQNRLVLPSWWVAAFDILGRADHAQDSPCALSKRMGISPALNRPELDSMGALLHSLQVQMLSGKRTLLISVNEHAKAASYQVRAAKFAYERLLQLASSLQLLPAQSDVQGAGWPLFHSVSWQEDRSLQDWRLRIELGKDSDELIFGYVEPYLELWRFWSKKERLGKYFAPKPPLKIWRSVWLDLQGFEQLLLVRLEKLIQWEQVELSFSQLHDLPLGQLFEGVRLRDYGEENPEALSQFRQVLRKLTRLGRKLGDHGLLSEPDSEDCLLANRQNNDPIVMWKTSRLYLDQVSDDHYESLLSVRYARKALARMDELLRMIMGPSVQTQVEENVLRFVKDVIALDDEELLLADSDLVVVYSSSPALVHPFLIYLEWWMRLLPNHPFPLPDWALDSPFAFILTKSSNEPSLENYREFIDSIRSQESPQHALARLFSVCFACPDMLKKQELIRHLAKTTKQQSREETMPKAAKLQESSLKVGRSSRGTSSSLLTTEKTQESKQLKWEAAEALKNLQSHDHQRYLQLKKAYIDSLTDEKRKLILEVESRLKPSIFDEHLRSSLVKFLIERPDLWKKSENR